MFKRIANRFMVSVLFFFVCAVPVCAAKMLVPAGEVVGLELQGNTITVTAFDQALSAGLEGGLRVGDEILTIDGHAIDSAADIRHALDRSDGDVEVVVDRAGKEIRLRVEPAVTDQGPRLGVLLRQGVTGIGTVTFYDPETGAFGTLGHGVNEPSGGLLDMTAGNVYPAGVTGIDRGRVGSPGQLRGSLNGEALLGTVSKNTAQGVFGTLHGSLDGEAVPVGASECVTTGPATIRSTVDGEGPREYSVEILKIYPKDRADGRNLLLRVTDPALLEATGGIVQGMGVSYNKDNQDNSLACRGVWCQSRFSLTNEN